MKSNQWLKLKFNYYSGWAGGRGGGGLDKTKSLLLSTLVEVVVEVEVELGYTHRFSASSLGALLAAEHVALHRVEIILPVLCQAPVD